MDSTTISTLPAYSSCIKIDGVSILPPLMTEARREEMRQYRQQAVEREDAKLINKLNLMRTFDLSHPTVFRTSTPTEQDEQSIVDADSESVSVDEEMCSTGSNPILKEKEESGEDSGGSGTSTGTFIIRSSLGPSARSSDDEGEDRNLNIEEQTSDSDEDVENFEHEVSTVLRRGHRSSPDQLCYKRKKPVRYFGSESPIHTPSTISSVLTDTSNLRNMDTDTPRTPPKYESEGANVVTPEFSPPHSSSVPQTPENVKTAIGLSKFQNKMQKINPALLKTRSPLLKGLVFPDPLERLSSSRSHTFKIPSIVHEPAMKLKFIKLTATIKGYLTRRLLNTDKIQSIIKTIRDTVELLLNLYEENQNFEIRAEDQGLHHRLIQQLTGACTSFHDIFFKISTKERMAIISNDRDKLRAKALKNVLNKRERAGLGQATGGAARALSPKRISTATLKSLERRKSGIGSTASSTASSARSPTRKRRITMESNRARPNKSHFSRRSYIP